MFNRDQNFRGNCFTRNLTLRLLMISRIQRSWHQFCDVTITGSFQTCLETNIRRRLQGPSQLSTPLYSQLILLIYTAMNGLGGRQNWVCHRARETLRTPLLQTSLL